MVFEKALPITIKKIIYIKSSHGIWKGLANYY